MIEIGEMVVERQSFSQTEIQLEPYPIAVVYPRHLIRLVGIALGTKLLHRSHHGSIADEGVVHSVILAIHTERDTLRITVIAVIGTDIQPRGNRSIKTNRGGQVHQFVFMTQVFVFRIVCTSIVHLCS